jgi:CheY-like chemotaxis protein
MVCFLTLKLPEMNGVEVLKEIKNLIKKLLLL